MKTKFIIICYVSVVVGMVSGVVAAGLVSHAQKEHGIDNNDLTIKPQEKHGANQVVAYHRSQVPNDPRTDAELTILAAESDPAALERFPDLKADYQAIQSERRRAFAPAMALKNSYYFGLEIGVAGFFASFLVVSFFGIALPWLWNSFLKRTKELSKAIRGKD